MNKNASFRFASTHRQNTLANVLQIEVLVGKLLPVDGFAPRAVVVRKVAPLAPLREGEKLANKDESDEWNRIAHMKPGITRWNVELAKPKPFSPVLNALKFSAVLGTLSFRRLIRILPAASPPISTSK